MRIKSLFAALAMLAAMVVALPQSASAGFLRHSQPDGWGRERVVRHHVYYPRYRHEYVRHRATDPYFYRYEPRGYYPYYNSRYWVRAGSHKKCRRHYKLPRYHKAWGYPKRGYNHGKWHARHHGRHRHHHW
ncbi:MAG: hypothetical protein KDJ47_17110 [Hyphomicrobiaceae bacterium]|nr:hypothetical protein [Hyphomicrobiaceae bacterium]